MTPRPLTGRRSIGSKATTPVGESRKQASRNGGAATRSQGARVVDWDAVIKRFKADMRKRYGGEGK